MKTFKQYDFEDGGTRLWKFQKQLNSPEALFKEIKN